MPLKRDDVWAIVFEHGRQLQELESATVSAICEVLGLESVSPTMVPNVGMLSPTYNSIPVITWGEIEQERNEAIRLQIQSQKSGSPADRQAYDEQVARVYSLMYAYHHADQAHSVPGTGAAHPD